MSTYKIPHSAKITKHLELLLVTFNLLCNLDKTMSTLLYIITMKSTLLETILVCSFLTHSVIKWKKYQKNWTYPSLEHTEGIFCYMLQKYIFGPLGLIIHATLVFLTLVVVVVMAIYSNYTNYWCKMTWFVCVFHASRFSTEFFLSENSLLSIVLVYIFMKNRIFYF